MGCFNIREIQTLLQTKDSSHSTESQDQRDLVNDTILGIRLRGMGFEDLQSGHKARLFEGLLLTSVRRDTVYFATEMTPLGTSVGLTLNPSLSEGVQYFYPHVELLGPLYTQVCTSLETAHQALRTLTLEEVSVKLERVKLEVEFAITDTVNAF
jgi:hypothetical protein